MSDTSRLHVGDCVEVLRTLPAHSVHCCVTSPPYWGLRDYGMAEQVGLEETPDAYVEKLVSVFREVRRVLRPDGVLWLNLGDTYAQERGHGYWGSPGKGDEYQQKTTKRWASKGAEDFGLRAGSLLGLPWKVALALQADGWILRSDTVWAKRNMLPESVSGWRWEPCRVKVKAERARQQGYAEAGGHRDKRHGNLEDQPAAAWQPCPGCARCAPNGGLVLRRGSWRPTRAHEYVFQLAKSPSYFGDGEDVREPNQPDTALRVARGHHRPGHKWEQGPGAQTIANDLDHAHNPAGRNLRDVWFLSSQPSRLHHFAMMPPTLVSKCVLSSCPSHVCSACGDPWARVIERGSSPPDTSQRRTAHYNTADRYGARNGGNGGFDALAARMRSGTNGKVTRGFRPTCECGVPAVPGTVLDPFLGAGTVAAAAELLGRYWVGVELNPKYADLLPSRIEEVRSYLSRQSVARGVPSKKQEKVTASPPTPRGRQQLGLFGAP